MRTFVATLAATAAVGALALQTPAAAAKEVPTTAPKITTVAPAAAAHDAPVTLVGQGFGKSTVSVAGVQAPVDVASGSRITFRVPEAAPVGVTTVRVSNGGRSATIAFEVLRSGGAGWSGKPGLVVDQTGTVSREVGADGGTITAGAATLTIPAGALLAPTTITVTPLLGLTGSPVDSAFVGGVRLEPDGLTFLQPVTLRLPAASSTGVVGFGTKGDGSSFHLVPAQVSGGYVTIPIWHFSSAGAVAPDATQLTATLQYVPTSAQELAVQALAVAFLAGNHENMVAAMKTWFTSSVRPGLEAAVGASQESFELAVGEWLAGWRAVAQLHGLTDDLTSEDEYAQGLALFAAADLAGRMLSRCTPTSAIGEPLEDLARLASVLQLDTIDFPLETRDYQGRDLPSADGLLEACVSVEVESVDHPAVLARDMANPLTARAATVFWNGGAVYDRSLRFELVDVGTMTEFVEDSAVVDDGTWETDVTPGDETTYGRVVRAKLTSGADPDVLEALRGSEGLSAPVRDRFELTVQPPGGVSYVDDLTSVQLGQTVLFRVQLAGPNVAGRTVSYSLTGPGALSETNGVTTTAGEEAFSYNATTAGSVTVTATFDGQTRSFSFEVTGVGVEVTPQVTSVTYGSTTDFDAVVSGSDDTDVTWSATGGSITASGAFTPDLVSLGSVTATHASGASDTVGFAIVQNVTVTVTPATATIVPSGSQQFTATVIGTDNPGVTWSTSGDAGTITSTGLFIAYGTPGSGTVTATSVADPTKSATALVTVAPPRGRVSFGGSGGASLSVGAETSAFKFGEGTTSCPPNGSQMENPDSGSGLPASWSQNLTCTTTSELAEGTETATGTGDVSYTVSGGADVTSVTVNGTLNATASGRGITSGITRGGAAVDLGIDGAVSYSASGSVSVQLSDQEHCLATSSFGTANFLGTWTAQGSGTVPVSTSGTLSDTNVSVGASGQLTVSSMGLNQSPCTGTVTFSITVTFS